MQKPKIVVIGGGTGTSVVLSGLKNQNVDLTALVSVADSGGSTGRLRDEFGFQPVGDLRQSLAALADDAKQTWIRKLLLYRFDHGKGLEGHNLGNLILTALQDMAGSTPKALEIAESIFKLKGKIYPITTTNVQLVIEYEDGTFLIGEDHLNPGNSGGKAIKQIRLSPNADLYDKARESIINADVIVIGPGDLYASILPNFVVSGFQDALNQSRAKTVYVVNLMTSFTQTSGYKASQHVNEIIRYAHKQPDFVLLNNGAIAQEILKKYESENEYPVEDDVNSDHGYAVIRDNFVSLVTPEKQAGDALHRTLLRHNEEKLTELIIQIAHK